MPSIPRRSADWQRGDVFPPRGPWAAEGWQANALAFAVAAAVFAFAMVWKSWIIFAGIIAGLWYGYRWLKRYYPEAAYLIVCFGHGFLSGLCGRRRRW
jgi:hypothetical protein